MAKPKKKVVKKLNLADDRKLKRPIPKVEIGKKPVLTPLMESYINYVESEGERPPSVHKFCKSLKKIQEKDFYEQFSSFYALDKAIWKYFVFKSIDEIKSEDNYEKYSAREKLLLFYFQLIENLNEKRTFFYYLNESDNKFTVKPQYLSGAKESFIDYVNELIEEGKEKTKEIVERSEYWNWDEQYSDGLWIQFMYVIRFWLQDESDGFEKTDEAIEKAVNLSFDLMGQWPFDSMYQFAKFYFQSSS